MSRIFIAIDFFFLTTAFTDHVILMRHLYINAKDNKTNDTFSNNCHKNVHPFQRILHWNED